MNHTQFIMLVSFSHFPSQKIVSFLPLRKQCVCLTSLSILKSRYTPLYLHVPKEEAGKENIVYLFRR